MIIFMKHGELVEGARTPLKFPEKEKRLEEFFGGYYKDVLTLAKNDTHDANYENISNSGADAVPEAVIVNAIVIGIDGFLTTQGLEALCGRVYPKGWVNGEVRSINYKSENDSDVQDGYGLGEDWQILAKKKSLLEI